HVGAVLFAVAQLDLRARLTWTLLPVFERDEAIRLELQRVTARLQLRVFESPLRIGPDPVGDSLAFDRQQQQLRRRDRLAGNRVHDGSGDPGGSGRIFARGHRGRGGIAYGRRRTERDVDRRAVARGGDAYQLAVVDR